MTIYRIERVDRVKRGEPACARSNGGYTIATAPEDGYAIWLAGLDEVVFVPNSALRQARGRKAVNTPREGHTALTGAQENGNGKRTSAERP